MEKKLLEDFEYRFKYLEHYTRVYKEDFPEKYQDVEIKTAKQMMADALSGDKTKLNKGNSGLTDEIDRRLA